MDILVLKTPILIYIHKINISFIYQTEVDLYKYFKCDFSFNTDKADANLIVHRISLDSEFGLSN